ncbi:DUF6009 family protein [Streptomyces sp. NBC_01445]|uniref:DUF6009 family protein n=1 Tax=Streptomyces sp. NBC_01445 TaxID=2903869 RepID=UPI002DDBB225|nr:DUF6009 family protein [Streptomyces sp. NBC_01445]WSE11229.1 DUF6009 family protein [Streptomyces sp. NBC_01445]
MRGGPRRSGRISRASPCCWRPAGSAGADLDYVRQALDKLSTHKGKPRYERDGRLIGYTNLTPKALRSADSGPFARRTFHLLPHDRPNRLDDPECPYRVGSPLAAVDPCTLEAGKTARSQGTAEMVPASP